MLAEFGHFPEERLQEVVGSLQAMLMRDCPRGFDGEAEFLG